MKSVGMIFIQIFLFNIFISNTSAQDITGMWKAIDDKNGYVRAKINIYKSNDGEYEGRIEEIYPLPGHSSALMDKCFKCKGELKDIPLKEMRILYGFKKNVNRPNEYNDGHVIDPMNGNIYKGKIKMNGNGTRIILRGYIGTSALGLSQVWIKID
ncbi:DUF2147 domain-containing protein [Acinetobacter guillouiae]|uniref:DUF2147 domain-containing protein n=1 Tax=Acinetobacter guillouiae TaxID=106649 RepID=UPI003AF59EBE